MKYKKWVLQLMIFFFLQTLIAQNSFLELLHVEVGTGLNYPLGYAPANNDFLQNSIYLNAIYELDEDFEIGSRFLYNAFQFGQNFSTISKPFEDPTKGRQFNKRLNEFRRYHAVDVYLLGRVKILKKHRWFGIGLELGFSNKTLVFQDSGLFNFMEPSVNIHGRSKILQFIWQERWRNWVQAVRFHYDFNKIDYRPEHGKGRILDLPSYFSYTIGYRFPVIRNEGKEKDRLLLRSVVKESSFSKINFLLGFNTLFPINFYGKTASLGGHLEVRYRPNHHYDFGGFFATQVPISFGTDRALVEEFGGHLSVQNLSGTISSYGVLVNYYLDFQEIDLFFGAGIERVERREVLNATEFFGGANVELFTIFPKQKNIGALIRTGWQFGNFRHTISYNFAGRNIPDYVSSTIGWNIGLFRKNEVTDFID